MMSPACLRLRKMFSRRLIGTFTMLTLAFHAQTALPAVTDYLINMWRSEDGLPQNSVNCLAQTPDGYLWIGTRSGGLARFDGLRFVNFNPQTTPELKDVEFETLSVDGQGTLWITAGNESVASMTNGKFHLVRERAALPRWHPLQMVAEDATAVYLAAFENAVFRIPRDGPVNEAQRLALAPAPPDPQPGQFYQAQDGALWYITDLHQVARMQWAAPGDVRFNVFNLGDPAQVMAKAQTGEIWVAAGSRIGVMTRDGFIDHTPTHGPSPRGVEEMIPARAGNLWLWDGKELREMSGGQWTLTVPDFRPSPSHGALRFFADSQGGLWVIEYGTGLWHVGPDGVVTLLTRENGLPSKFITCWLEDNEGNLWIGTKEAGLARIRRRQFQEFTAADGIPGDVAQSVCEDAQGTIWVGTATGGLARKEGGKFVPVPLAPKPDPLIESVTVCPDATNGIWIGTLQGSIFRYFNREVQSVNNEAARSFPLERLRDHVANAMMQDSKGRVWFGNGSGAYYFKDGLLSAFDRTAGFVDNLGVRAIAEGPPGTLWFGTEPGDVWRFSHGALTQYHPPREWPYARVSALLPDTDGGVWVGTLGGGLLHLDHGNFTRITTHQGLPDNSITQLLADDAGNLWGGTYAGIFRAAKSDLKSLAAGATNSIVLSVFGHFDGLSPQAYSGWFQPSCWRSHDGRLWFTTVKGLVMVDPREVMVNHRPPPVIIEEMRVDGDPRDFSSAVSGEKHLLHIEPGRHYVEFRFTGIDFTAPDKLRFKWRLEGAEKQWRDGLGQRAVAYGPLWPGNYSFHVLAANSDGIWNETGAGVNFTVLPYFWETWWFRTFLAAGTCLALVTVVVQALRRRHKLELERLERSHEMERERARIAQDLHDDLGTSLTQISLMSSLLDRENAAPAETRSLTREIRATSRTMVAALNEIVWAVNPKNDSLNELAGYLGNVAEAFFRPGPIRCRLDIPNDLPDHPLTSEVRHGLFLAFKEAINNVAKHSRATEIQVHIRCPESELQLAIQDDGIGFDPAAKRPGNGLMNMRHRLEKMGGNCEVRSAPGEAATVLFRLKLPRRI